MQLLQDQGRLWPRTLGSCLPRACRTGIGSWAVFCFRFAVRGGPCTSGLCLEASPRGAGPVLLFLSCSFPSRYSEL